MISALEGIGEEAVRVLKSDDRLEDRVHVQLFPAVQLDGFQVQLDVPRLDQDHSRRRRLIERGELLQEAVHVIRAAADGAAESALLEDQAGGAVLHDQPLDQEALDVPLINSDGKIVRLPHPATAEQPRLTHLGQIDPAIPAMFARRRYRHAAASAIGVGVRRRRAADPAELGRLDDPAGTAFFRAAIGENTHKPFPSFPAPRPRQCVSIGLSTWAVSPT